MTTEHRRVHRYKDGRCACGASAPKHKGRVEPCTRPPAPGHDAVLTQRLAAELRRLADATGLRLTRAMAERCALTLDAGVLDGHPAEARRAVLAEIEVQVQNATGAAADFWARARSLVERPIQLRREPPVSRLEALPPAERAAFSASGRRAWAAAPVEAHLAAGRKAADTRERRGTTPRGARHWAFKLLPEKRRTLFELARAGVSQTKIAKEIGVSRGYVGQLLRDADIVYGKGRRTKRITRKVAA